MPLSCPVHGGPPQGLLFVGLFPAVLSPRPSHGLRRQLLAALGVCRTLKDRLQAERAQLFELLDLLPGLVCVRESGHTIRFGNRRFRELFEDPIGRPCYEVFHRRTEPCTDCRGTLALSQDGECVSEHTSPTTGRVYRVHSYALSDTAGTPLLLELGLDITDRKRLEIELRESEERYRSLFEGNSAVMLLVDPEDGRIVEANHAAAAFYGYAREELAGRPVGLLSLSRPEEVLDRLRGAAAGGLQRYEATHRLADGSLRHVDVYASPARVGGRTLCLAMFQDVTESRRAQAEREAAGRTLQAVIEAAPLAMCMLDRACAVRVWNAAAERMFGWTRDVVLGQAVPPLPTGDGTTLRDACARALEGEAFQHREWRLYRKDGSPIHVAVSASPLPDADGRPDKLVVTAEDITELRRTETESRLRQQQLVQADKMLAIGTLIGGIAHEVNNPIGCISLSVSLLLEAWHSSASVLEEHRRRNGNFLLGTLSYDEMREQIPQMLGSIQQGAARIGAIVNDLKEYARTKPQNTLEAVDVNAVVASATTLLSSTLRRSTYRFELRYGSGLRPARAEYQQLEQVIINLLLNACQSLPNPERGIRLNTSYDAEADEVRVEVRDEGAGIAPEHMARLGQPFFTTRRDRSGLGLGLAVSEGIVRNYGGRLLFDSRPGEGTTVLLALPAAAEEAATRDE